MSGNETERPQTAIVLERWRTRLRLAKQKLADLADVSATYVRLIESGQDDVGRVVVPSAGIIQKLARGLARAEPAEARRADVERQAYADLMSAAGYLAPLAADQSSQPVLSADDEGIEREAQGQDLTSLLPASREDGEQATPSRSPAPLRYRADAMNRSAPAADSRPANGREIRLSLRDERLHPHLLPLLSDWESLDPRDQSLLLEVFELIAERHGRRRDRG